MASTAGERASWGLLTTAAVALAVAPVACGPADEVIEYDETIESALVEARATVITEALDRFAQDTRALQERLVAWDAALQAGEDGGAIREAAQQDWIAAMESWQILEMMQIGPAGSSLDVLGGEDLRDEIYSWPTVNPCRVDQVTADGSFSSADFFEQNLVNAYGLDALEHVLWGEAATVCPGQVPPVSDGTWDALGSGGVEASRAALGVVLVGGVLDRAAELQQAWEGSFGDDFATGSGVYRNQQEALNALTDALFYLELQTRDHKLFDPLQDAACTAGPCADAVELGRSGASLVAIEANLRGFEALFFAGEGMGIEGVLQSRDHGALAEEVASSLDAAFAALEAVDGPLAEAVYSDRADVEALFEAVTVVGDLLEADVMTALTLRVPTEAAGDLD